MEKAVIIIADKKGYYIDVLEEKFVSELGRKVEIEIITDDAYFSSYFSIPRNVEVLIVGEDFYCEALRRHNIQQIFLLTENRREGEPWLTCLYRYGSIEEIYNEILGKSRELLLKKDEAEKKTQVIAFYSSIGGCGKTLLSMAAAKYLSSQQKKIFYMSTENVQSFAYFLEQESGVPREFYKGIRGIEENTFEIVERSIRKEGFFYLPPLKTSLESFQIGMEFWENLLDTCKENGDYDYIIVDIEAGYDMRKLNLLQQADKAVIVIMQDRLSVTKMEYLLNNLDMGNREKCFCVCNRYKEEQEDFYRESGLWRRMPVTEYIREYQKENFDIQELANDRELQKTMISLI